MADGEPAQGQPEGRRVAPKGVARARRDRVPGCPPERRLTDADRLTESGEHAVRSDIVCQITRFGLRRPIDLVRTYLDYRRARRQARHVPGFLCAAFLIEDSRTCYTLSLWRDLRAIADFGTSAPAHLAAARQVMGHLRFQPDRGPELWSTKWRLHSVSSNLNWGNFDLRGCLRRTARTAHE